MTAFVVTEAFVYPSTAGPWISAAWRSSSSHMDVTRPYC